MTDTALTHPLAAGTDDSPLAGASFGQAISRFYRRYATFSGRASRSEYWWMALFFWLVLTGGSVLAVLLGATTTSAGDLEEPGPAGVVVMLVLMAFLMGSFVPALALNARRLHDANITGWAQLVCLLPGLGGVVMMVLAILPSQPAGAAYDRGPLPSPTAAA